MSAYNTVKVKRLVPCRRCGDAGVIKVQFAYGDTQQYSYSMGDKGPGTAEAPLTPAVKSPGCRAQPTVKLVNPTYWV
jgi:hypothetical protein